MFEKMAMLLLPYKNQCGAPFIFKKHEKVKVLMG